MINSEHQPVCSTVVAARVRALHPCIHRRIVEADSIEDVMVELAEEIVVRLARAAARPDGAAVMREVGRLLLGGEVLAGANGRVHADDVDRIAARVVEALRTRGGSDPQQVQRPPALLDRRGAARFLHMSPATFDRRVRRYVNVVATGGRPLYRPEDLDRWAASRSRRVPPLPAPPRRRQETGSEDSEGALRDRATFGMVVEK